MHEVLLLLLGCILSTCESRTVGFGPLAADTGGWSWRGGLLGEDRDPDDVFDDDVRIPGYLCDKCRDPAEYPMDFVAVAYNGYFGEDPWMRDSQLGIPFRIYNLAGQWVVVWFEGVVFDVATLLPDTMNVRLRMPDGRILTFTVLQGGPDLPIGDPNPTPPTTDERISTPT